MSLNNGLNEYCYSVGFDHGSLSINPDPIGEGISAMPCTTNENANQSYYNGYLDAMVSSGISSGDSYENNNIYPDNNNQATTENNNIYPYNNNQATTETKMSTKLNAKIIKRYNNYYRGSSGEIWCYSLKRYLPYAQVIIYHPGNTCQCIYFNKKYMPNHIPVCLDTLYGNVYNELEIKTVYVCYDPSNTSCQCIYQFNESGYDIEHAKVCSYNN
ncbi:hypothetical protein Hokovirus_2_226 [Hokovirus HKV1]|uniref:Uncharacterized protein n=1 Tax=Hokovirus HKV1 TaxID=1977638 RepID=A0A1V0SG52_9VIRU|nr:hypothetical protein Hokovirus_2_226 [Hokovirus HKV1]